MNPTSEQNYPEDLRPSNEEKLRKVERPNGPTLLIFVQGNFFKTPEQIVAVLHDPNSGLEEKVDVSSSSFRRFTQAYKRLKNLSINPKKELTSLERQLLEDATIPIEGWKQKMNTIPASFLNEVENIILLVDSEGGSVAFSDSINCFLQFIKETSSASIQCFIGSIAYSAAADIALSADNITALKDSGILLHTSDSLSDEITQREEQAMLEIAQGGKPNNSVLQKVQSAIADEANTRSEVRCLGEELYEAGLINDIANTIDEMRKKLEEALGGEEVLNGGAEIANLARTFLHLLFIRKKVSAKGSVFLPFQFDFTDGLINQGPEYEVPELLKIMHNLHFEREEALGTWESDPIF